MLLANLAGPTWTVAPHDATSAHEVGDAWTVAVAAPGVGLEAENAVGAGRSVELAGSQAVLLVRGIRGAALR
jgi:hypothetical protein